MSLRHLPRIIVKPKSDDDDDPSSTTRGMVHLDEIPAPKPISMAFPRGHFAVVASLTGVQLGGFSVSVPCLTYVSTKVSLTGTLAVNNILKYTYTLFAESVGGLCSGVVGWQRPPPIPEPEPFPTGQMQ